MSLHKNWSFPLRFSSVNATKSAVNCGFGHIYRINPQWKSYVFVKCCLYLVKISFVEKGFALITLFYGVQCLMICQRCHKKKSSETSFQDFLNINPSGCIGWTEVIQGVCMMYRMLFEHTFPEFFMFSGGINREHCSESFRMLSILGEYLFLFHYKFCKTY